MIPLSLDAFRATDPQNMMAQQEPIGSENDFYLNELTMKSQKIIACRENHGAYKQRSTAVKELLKNKLYYLEINKTGEPKHPLYIHSETQIKPFK